MSSFRKEKIIIYLFFLVAFVSCKKTIENEGVIVLKDGLNKEVNVDYSFKSVPEKLNYDTFYDICKEVSSKAKSLCKVHGTYVPIKINFEGIDTMMVSISFTAQNIFGVKDLLSQSYSLIMKGRKYEFEDELVVTDNGESVYTAYCQSCHGVGGANGAGGLDLTVSQTDHAAKLERIKNGASSMPGFKDVLNEKEIDAVTAYIESLKK